MAKCIEHNQNRSRPLIGAKQSCVSRKCSMQTVRISLPLFLKRFGSKVISTTFDPFGVGVFDCVVHILPTSNQESSLLRSLPWKDALGSISINRSKKAADPIFAAPATDEASHKGPNERRI
ncbi:hypothetical protein VARIO8X_110171 [Burkholderiales bacterium 8X]|nr:hypothetical protein VARIO8X_110171 [Burkholderiales bacterium 8X]